MLLTDRRLSTTYERGGTEGEQQAKGLKRMGERVFYFDGKAAYAIEAIIYQAALTIPPKRWCELIRSLGEPSIG
jgi:hypothetical protein